MAKSNGWTKHNRPPVEGFRTWRPDQEDENHVLVGTLAGSELVDTKFGAQQVYTIHTTDDCHDREGHISKGDDVQVWECADLKPLASLPEGAEVRLTPDGYLGKRKLFQVESR